MSIRTNDACLRRALKERLALRYRDDADVIIVEELPASRASTRVDMAVLNGHLHGFEIKSDLDTLARLPRQVAAFSPSMQAMTLVVADRHLEQALDLVPDWWGLMTASPTALGRIKFKAVRRGRRNRVIDARSVAELLEREELLAVLRRRQADHGVRTADYRAILDRAVSSIPVRNLIDEVREELKFRVAWEAAQGATAFGRSALLLNASYRPVSFSPVSSCAG